jgi:predicted kinase
VAGGQGGSRCSDATSGRDWGSVPAGAARYRSPTVQPRLVTRTVLINGVPGSGKSTVAQLLARGTPMALALDIDGIKHALGQWESDPTGAGRQARRIALAAAEAHLATGHDVIMGQYLARTEFVEQLEQLSRRLGSRFFEFVLVVDQPTLRARLEHRAMHPHRPEHEVNARLAVPA